MKLTDELPELQGAARFLVFDGEVADQAREVSVLPDEGPYWIREGGRIFVPRPKPIVDSGWKKNTIVTNGKGLLLDRLFGLAAAVAITSIGIGASLTASAVTDTQLGTTPTLQTQDATFPSRAALVVTNQGTFATGVANVNWQECALFNGNTNGTSVMLDRIAPIGPFTKTAAVSIILQITITQS
jgi:hypothetical protein